MKKVTCLFLFFLLTTYSSLAAQDNETILLKNGDRLTGDIVKQEENHLIFSTKYMGEVKILWDEILGVESKRKLYLKLQDGNSVSAEGIKLNENDQWVMNSPVLGQVQVNKDQVLVIATNEDDARPQYTEIKAELAAKKEELRKITDIGELWSGNLNVAFSGNEGNENSLSFLGSADIKRTGPTDTFTAGMRYKTTTANEETTANEATGFLKEQINMTERFYLYGELSAEWNEEKDIELKFIAEIGIGYFLLKPGDYHMFEDDKITLIHEFAAAFSSTDLDDGDDTQSLGFTTGILYAQVFSNKWKLTLEGKYFQGLNETDDYQLTGEITLAIPLSESLSFTSSVRDRYINLVEGDNKRNDVDWALGLRYSF